MSLRSHGLTVTAGVLTGLFAAWAGVSLLSLGLVPTDAIDNRGALAAVVAGAFAVALAVSIRSFMAGVIVRSDAVLVRTVSGTTRIPAVEVAGLVAQPIWGRRAWRVAVVRRDGTVTPASWTAVRRPLPPWTAALTAADERVAWSAGPGARATAVLEERGLLDEPAPEVSLTAWQAPPGWEQPPLGWVPPMYWQPPVDWPAAPPDWQWWRPIALPVAVAAQPLSPATVGQPAGQPAGRWLGRETVIVMAAFLVPSIAGAVGGLIEDLVGGKQLNNFALPLPGHVTVSLLLLILSYVPLGAVVPVALLLLARSGQSPRSLGLTLRCGLTDLAPAAGLAVASYLAVIIVSLVLNPVLNNAAVSNTANDTHVPPYFVIYAITLAATTAITEEVFVNGYLLTRLSQLGWRPWPAFALSLALRTSYHLYYGAAIIVTIPFGWFVTRSFQKHGRLTRPILAHFLYDATLLTIAVLAS